MTPQDAAKILEPAWMGLLAARVRLAEAFAEAEKLTGRDAWRQISDLVSAEAYLAELARRFEPAGLDAVLELADGTRLTWPTAPADGAQREAQRRYLENRPEAVAALASEKMQTLRRLA